MKILRNPHRPAFAALACATGILAAALLTPAALRAQSPAASAQEKINLMASAIEARNQGNLPEAKAYFERLAVLAPGDAYVSRELAAINAQLGAPAGSVAPAGSGPPAGAVAASPGATTGAPAPASPAAEAAAPAAPAAPPLSSEEQAAMARELGEQHTRIAIANVMLREASSLVSAGELAQARQMLTLLRQQMPDGAAYAAINAQLNQEIGTIILAQANQAYNAKDDVAAQGYLNQYVSAVGQDARSQAFAQKLANAPYDPTHLSINETSPAFVQIQEEVKRMNAVGINQYLYGDYDGALRTFSQVTSLDPNNAEAQAYMNIINKILFDASYISRLNTRKQLLTIVNQSWVLPAPYEPERIEGPGSDEINVVGMKLANITIPTINFENLELNRVVETLSILSRQFDDPDILLPEINPNPGTGVNIVVIPPSAAEIEGARNATPPYTINPNPPINLILNGASLQTILSNVASIAGYVYEVEDGVITFRYLGGGGGSSVPGRFQMRVYPMPAEVLNRLLPLDDSGTSSATLAPNPFAAPVAPGATDAAAAADQPSDTERSLLSFFTRAGIHFPPGATLALTREDLFVRNTPSNLNLLSDILKRYGETKLVEIESRFLEVNQSELQELGFQWNVNNPNNMRNFLRTGTTPANNTLRLIDAAFPTGQSGRTPTTVDIAATQANPIAGTPGTEAINRVFPQAIPSLPGAVNTGAGMSSVFSGVLGVLNGWDVQVIVNALEQTTGADLMSAPKVTVLSGKTALITVAQELRYPQEFEAGSATPSGGGGGGNTGGGGGGQASATIQPGTPGDFVMREVGVVMHVSPTVLSDDSIYMELNPSVTEFEGFIEYGGVAVGIVGTTVVTSPSGFIQPVFSVRQVTTAVTLFDGSTLVLGGLTREEVRSVHDKVPILGDLPLIGRLFQSKGETSTKRNLMIFVTANLISRYGAPLNQSFPGVPAGTAFRFPQLVTPSRSLSRGQGTVAETAPAATETPAAPAPAAPATTATP